VAERWAAPFSTYRTRVPEEWVDYNGHMHDASYLVALSEANEALFDALDLGAGYYQAVGASYFTVEYHIKYKAECASGDVLTAETLLVAADPKRIRLYTELKHDDGRLAASGESLYLHVDRRTGRVADVAPDRYRPVQEVLAAHAGMHRARMVPERG
jgi:acyl-CoA thioester hydrolase